VPYRAGVHPRVWGCEIKPATSQHKTLVPVKHPRSLNEVATKPPVQRPSQIGAVPSQWQLTKRVWASAKPMHKTPTITRIPIVLSAD
jgi:hypothetical protein